MEKKYLAGFDCLDEVKSGLRTYPVATTENIVKGNAVYSNSGYAANAASLATTYLGVAVANANNTSGADGAINVQVIPPNMGYRFRVPVEANQVVTQADVGLILDLESAYSVDRNDTAVTSMGFKVLEIDISTDAIAINTYGYVIGVFVPVS